MNICGHFCQDLLPKLDINRLGKSAIKALEWDFPIMSANVAVDNVSGMFNQPLGYHRPGADGAPKSGL